MESSAAGRCMSQKSKKRVFPESSSGAEAKGESSSSPGNRTLKGKNKMYKQNEGMIELDSEDTNSDSYNGKDYIDLSTEDEYTASHSHFDNIYLPTFNSNSPFLDSIKTKSAYGFVHSAHSDRSMPCLSPSIFAERVKASSDHAKGTKTTAGSSSVTSPSLRLRKDAMKVRSIKKPVKTRSHKMSSGSGQITPMEDVRLEQDSGKNQKSSNVAESSSDIGQHENNDVVRKYPNFKKFDIVEDHSDHQYAMSNSEMMQPPRNWAKRIQQEWKILKKDLPDTIFVRVYESRMDLLRAVIIGAEGTPYHDGLFFFDVFFPNNYPMSPPKVHYHSGGLRINPNLYNDGKVCLSLLNTWIGCKNENWVPGVSTMLQVLVSIQGLILNSKPYFNEPAYADMGGSGYGESQSLLYNERTLIYSLKTMVYTMKNPPKHFEDMVIGHFRDRAVAILNTCKGYINGVGVGCGEDKGSRGFGKNVDRYMGTLVGAFKEIGVENVDEFLPPTLNLTQKIRAFFGI